MGEPVPVSPAPPGLGDLRSLDSLRISARILDFLLLALVYVFVLVASGPLEWWQLVALLWLEVTYFFVCEATTGQTLGKRHYGVRVVSRDGTVPDANSIAARNVIRIFEEPILAVLVLVGSRSRRQRIGDLVAGTTVARADQTPAPVPTARLAAYPAVWAVGAVLFALLSGPEPNERSPDPTERSGYYPPAPSLAGAMRPEWEEFATAVDRICAHNFNRAMASQYGISETLRARGLPTAKIEASVRYSWAHFQRATYRMTGRLGEAPAKAELFGRWRENVGRRATLFRQAGNAWLAGHPGQADRIHARMDQLKVVANDLGQHFGLRVCTSNGPGRPPTA